ncbi:hypothetical protein [Zestomonas thermotolerans]|jgi:hypothetical protein|uniref:hypothetical protein n=1 Tax=Zestomonas thermotolerans TaxID=157784 RepID=UPI0006880D14|nr:hypothetical protein [Pseudomonas thermotolerans]
MKNYMLLTAIALAVSLPVQGASVLNPEELSDKELSQLRGRFVMPGRVVHFGFTMVSSWQNAQGQMIGAKVDMQAQHGMYRPVFRVSTLNDDAGYGGLPESLPQGTITGGAGLTRVDGASQSIRAAGDHNTAENRIALNVKYGNTAPALNTSGKPLTSQITSSNGAGSVQVTPGNNALQITIQANNGQGSAIHKIGAGALMQNTQIMSSHNVVKNLAALDVVLRENRATINTLNCNWDQLRGLRPSGI